MRPFPSGTFQLLPPLLPGDGDGGELRRDPRPSLRLRQAGEPLPRGARPGPSPLRLPPRRRLVGPVQSRKRRTPLVRMYVSRSDSDGFFGVFFAASAGAGGGGRVGAQLRPPFPPR